MEIISNLGFSLTPTFERRLSNHLPPRIVKLEIMSFNIIYLGITQYEVYCVIKINGILTSLSRIYNNSDPIDFEFNRDADKNSREYGSFFGSQFIMLLNKIV